MTRNARKDDVTDKKCEAVRLRLSTSYSRSQTLY